MKKRKLNITPNTHYLLIVLLGILVFTGGLSICLRMSRLSSEKMAKASLQSNLNLLHTYVDGQLNSVENIIYAVYWCDNRNYVVYDPQIGLSEQSMSYMFKSVLNIDPLVSGLAMALAPPYHGMVPGRYGYVIYCSNIRGKEAETVMVGDKYDYTVKDWYSVPMESGTVFWSKPYRESISGDLITSFSMPILESEGGAKIGVVLIDVSMDRFQNLCSKILPYVNSKAVIIDEDFRFICHPDKSRLFQDIGDSEYNGYYSELKKQIESSDSGQLTLSDGKSESLLYFEKIPRTRWTICIECPKEEIYRDSDALKHKMLAIALISILLLAICMRYLYGRLIKTTLAKADIENDLKHAANAQNEIVPHEFPAFPSHEGIDIFACLHPAREVGGDLYDYFIVGNKLFFCIGDVSGKGLQASMFMAATHYIFRSASAGMSVADTVRQMNVALCTNNAQCRFVTFWLGCLDLENGSLEYVNAGHDSPVLLRDGRLEVFPPSGNMPLGVMEDENFISSGTTLLPGDSLLLYTDGVTEAMDAQGHVFGRECMLQAVEASSGADASGIITAVLEKVRQHASGAMQSDDITMLCLKFIKGETKS